MACDPTNLRAQVRSLDSRGSQLAGLDQMLRDLADLAPGAARRATEPVERGDRVQPVASHEVADATLDDHPIVQRVLQLRGQTSSSVRGVPTLPQDDAPVSAAVRRASSAPATVAGVIRSGRTFHVSACWRLRGGREDIIGIVSHRRRKLGVGQAQGLEHVVEHAVAQLGGPRCPEHLPRRVEMSDQVAFGLCREQPSPAPARSGGTVRRDLGLRLGQTPVEVRSPGRGRQQSEPATDTVEITSQCFDDILRVHHQRPGQHRHPAAAPGPCSTKHAGARGEQSALVRPVGAARRISTHVRYAAVASDGPRVDAPDRPSVTETRSTGSAARRRGGRPASGHIRSGIAAAARQRGTGH